MRLRPIRPVLAAVLAVVLGGCGSDPETKRERAELAPTTVGAAASERPTTAPTPAATTAPRPVTTTRPPVALGPEWVQRDGRVLIEAAASSDPHVLLRDLQALGLTEGVVFGQLVNGWLPIRSFEQMRTLSTLQFVRPTGAGTG